MAVHKSNTRPKNFDTSFCVQYAFKLLAIIYEYKTIAFKVVTTVDFIVHLFLISLAYRIDGVLR